MSTLSVLKTSVDAWLARDDVAVANPQFPQIMLIAESEISRDVVALVQEKSTTLVFTDRDAALPADFLNVREPFIDNDHRRFEYMTPQALHESRVWNNGRAGAFYTLEGDPSIPGDERVKMVIAGPASVSDPLSVVVNYYARFAPLLLDTDTNWLLRNHFDVYLYATLRAACEFLQEDVLEDRYLAKYERAVAKQSKHENRKRIAAVPKQSYGNPRTTV